VNKLIEHITNKDKILAIIIRNQFEREGIDFFTPDEFSQQLAYMKRPKDYIIPPHVHNRVTRKVQLTQEVLFIKSGKMRVDFYDDERHYVKSEILESGDVILLASGGHGFEALEEIEIIEVKQGPYTGDEDKTRFPGIDKEKIIVGGITDD